MKNYQLYKTDVLLSGQMKWDLIIGNYNGELYVKDFHLTPVSDYVPYNKCATDDIINYEHRYNIKDFYNKTIGYFYSTPVNHCMNNDWPIVKNKNIKIPYDDTYFAGCSRLNFDIYKKQFQYFCPAWVEHISPDNTLAFKLSIFSKKYQISNNVLNLNIKHGDVFEYHNKFVKYLYNYLTYVNIRSEFGCDDIIDINLYKKEAYLKGIDVTAGNLVVSNISNIVDNLLSRERPLMEFDTYITESFKNTKTITPNLINFNICFNMNDVVHNSVLDRMMGSGLNIKMDIGEFGIVLNEFDKTDIYTNYEYIPRDFCRDLIKMNNDYDIIDENDDRPAPNVLDYFRDDRYINFMNKNKAVQKICHWQLVGNDNYIFNLYDGFGGYVREGDNTFLINHRYSTTPDLYQSIYNKKSNNLAWVNTFEINESKFRYIINNYQTLIDDNRITKFERGWVNNIKYNYTGEPLYVISGWMNDDVDLELLVDGANILYVDGYLVCSLGGGNILFICSKDRNMLTFAAITSLIRRVGESSNTKIGSIEQLPERSDLYRFIPNDHVFTLSGGNLNVESPVSYVDEHSLVLLSGNVSIDISESMYKLGKILDSVELIPLVIIDNSLSVVSCDSPSLSSTEVEYYKNNNKRNYLIRYDGKIKPCFGYGDNFLYYKIYSNDEDVKYINKYSSSGYPPLFKSIKYYAYRNELIKYQTPSTLIADNYEYKWFENNKYMYVPNVMQFTISSKTSSIDDVNKSVKEYLLKMFNVSDDKGADYVLTLFNIRYNLLQYTNNEYTYEIKLNIK